MQKYLFKIKCFFSVQKISVLVDILLSCKFKDNKNKNYFEIYKDMNYIQIKLILLNVKYFLHFRR